jgi:putative transposase
VVLRSPFPDVNTFRQALERADKPARVDGSSGRTLTYGQLTGAIQRAAAGPAARGFRKGMVGALANLGYTVSDQSVGNILKRHGLQPASERQKNTVWEEFISTHMDVLEVTDSFTASLYEDRHLLRRGDHNLVDVLATDRALSRPFA